MTTILDISGNPIEPIWLAEFRGFFYGEGYLGICSWGKHPKGYTNLRARAQITSRSDDADILHDIHAKLGGIVYLEGKGRVSNNGTQKYQSNPYVVWRSVKKSELVRICDILVDGILPARKKMQINTIRQFLDTVPAPGHKVSAELHTLQEALWNQIKDLHAYSDF